MRTIANFFSGVLVCVLVPACAAIQPEPCTSDWVKWQTHEITRDFRDKYDQQIRDLARFSKRLEEPGPLTVMQIPARLTEFQDMAEDFSQTVLPDLRSAVDQCGTPTKFVSAFSGLLEEQGVDRSVLTWVEDTAVLIEKNFPETADGSKL